MNNDPNPHRARQLVEAKFDPRLRTYTYIGGILFCIITIIGIIFLPFWLILGRKYINRYYDNLFCELTTRALHFKKGVWFHTEKTIPLDKIQDLTFKEGPFLRYFGLSRLKVETAGQSMEGAADMSLTGIIDARKFREAVLDQRDEITDKGPSYQSPKPAAPEESGELIPLMHEILKTLKNIEKKSG